MTSQNIRRLVCVVISGFAVAMTAKPGAAAPSSEARERYKAGSVNEAALVAYDGCKKKKRLQCLQAAIYFAADGQPELMTEILQQSKGIKAEGYSFALERKILEDLTAQGKLSEVTVELENLAVQLSSSSFLLNILATDLGSGRVFSSEEISQLVKAITKHLSSADETSKLKLSEALSAATLQGQLGRLSQATQTLAKLLSGKLFMDSLEYGVRSQQELSKQELKVLGILCRRASSLLQRERISSMLVFVSGPQIEQVTPMTEEGQACAWARPKVRLRKVPLAAEIRLGEVSVAPLKEGTDLLLAVPAGKGTLYIEKPGRNSFELDYEADFGTEVAVDIRMDKVAPSWRALVGWSGVGLAAAGAGVFGFGFTQAENAKSTLTESLGANGVYRPGAYNDAVSAEDSANMLGNVGLGLVGVGITALSTAVVHWMLEDLTAPEWSE